jgi:hypothetical protein
MKVNIQTVELKIFAMRLIASKAFWRDRAMAQVEVLQYFGAETQLKRKWMRMWDDLGKRILRMPKWMQDIVLEDINTAIRNRISVMEMIQNTHKTIKVGEIHD